MVVGERHTKETVIQDCNSYIKVIIYWNLFSSNMMRSVIKSFKTATSYFRIFIGLSIQTRPTKIAKEQYGSYRDNLKVYQEKSNN